MAGIFTTPDDVVMKRKDLRELQRKADAYDALQKEIEEAKRAKKAAPTPPPVPAPTIPRRARTTGGK